MNFTPHPRESPSTLQREFILSTCIRSLILLVATQIFNHTWGYSIVTNKHCNIPQKCNDPSVDLILFSTPFPSTQKRLSTLSKLRTFASDLLKWSKMLNSHKEVNGLVHKQMLTFKSKIFLTTCSVSIVDRGIDIDGWLTAFKNSSHDLHLNAFALKTSQTKQVLKWFMTPRNTPAVRDF